MTKCLKPYFWILWVLSPLLTYGQRTYTPSMADPLTESRRFALFPELENQGVRCITSFPQSELYWFGLDSGIASYDGYNWKVFGENDGVFKPADKILITKNETVYAVGQNGLIKLVDGQWQFVFQMPSEIRLFTKSFKQLSSGNLIISSQLGVILVKQNERPYLLTSQKKWEEYEAYNEVFQYVQIPEIYLTEGEYSGSTDTHELSPGVLWVAIDYRRQEEKGEILQVTEKDILSGSLTSVEMLSHFYGIRLGDQQTIFQASNGVIWVINHSNRVAALAYSNGVWERIDFGSKLNTNFYAENIEETPDGKIWITGVGKIYTMDTSGQWVNYNSEDLGIKQTHIDLHVGNYNDLWIFGSKSNVYKVDMSQDKWVGYLGLNFQCQTSDGTSWFLDIDGNIIKKKNGKWIILDKTANQIEDPVSLYAAKDDIIWLVGSQDQTAAASYLKDGNWEMIIMPALSWGVDYRAFYESKEGEIWLGATSDVHDDRKQLGGVIQIKNPYDIENRKFTHHIPHTTASGLAKQNAYGLAQSKDGRIWLGGSYLDYWEGDIWHRLDSIEALDDYVNEVYNDQNGTLYVGSRHHGLYILKENQWTNYTSDGDLTSNNIIGIASDEEGKKIWIATDKGYSHFNGTLWINDIFPQELTLSYEGGAIFNIDDQLWISVSPREWKRRVYDQSPLSKKVIQNFQSYKYEGDTISPETWIDSYTESVDHFGNTAIFWSGKDFFNTTKTESLLFSYQLDDQKWSPYSHETSHTFLSLTDGKHTFKVRAMRKEGNVDPTPAQIEFTVLPPVWKQLWFITLLILFMGIIFYYQYQIYQKRLILQSVNADLEKSNTTLVKKTEELADALDQLKQAQTKLIQNEKMATLGVLSAGVAHEINNPLNFIKGGVDGLLPIVSELEKKDKNLAKFVKIINEGVKRANAIVKGLGKFSRQTDSTIETCDIHRILEDCLLILHGTMKNNIEIERDFCSEQLIVTGNEGKLHQAFLNILANAQQAIVGNGKIAIITTVNDESCQIKITDTGVGMSEEHMTRVGEPFFTTKGPGEGTGLGMAITISIIEEHQGGLSLDSVESQGSTFTISLPLKVS
ncbi:sensor histidine kinase [Reichenbachiella ulvae]|uniref:histidine kinase n=1 Tax=Reichenbachiella ulvae TaxID=2980104 RepID=A0ABT3CVF5_9BACT|nr:ATP-binding protein [Reichenbachiella ulvae]MCV9387599.1 ATP-binding protein [Reichenbachiella ulvae]